MVKQINTKKRTKWVSRVMVLSLIVLNLSAILAPVHASDVDDLQLSLTSNKDVDVVLTLGKTTMQVSNFGNDLKNKLVQKGVNLNRINMSAVETNTQNVQNSFVWNQDVSSSIGSISFQNSGTKIQMYGNTTNAGFNKIYTPNNTDPEIKEQEMSFSYNLNFGDSFDGAGVLLNTHVTNNLMNGYALFIRNGTTELYKLTNWSNSNNQDLRSSSNAKLISTINMGTSGSFRIKTTRDKVIITKNGSQLGTLTLPEHFGWGFGFFSDHYSHGCDQIGQFSLTDVKLDLTKAKDFKEVIKEPKWRDLSKRFMINVDDEKVLDFDKSGALGEILPRFINDEIHFIGLGTTVNKAQTEAFIAKNNNYGAFFSNLNYQQALESTATYIVSQLIDDTGDGQYVLVGDPINVSVSPSTLAKNTQTSEYPQGRWKIDHDYTYYENHTGQASWANQWQKDLQMVFDKPGRYDISFGDKHPNPRYVYAHRKPIASFSNIVKNNGSTFGITIQDYSYDLDMESRTDKGIAEHEWKWKKTTDNNWTNGVIPSSLAIGNDYIVQLRVKDYQGVWSTPESRYITTASIVARPVSNFTVSPNTVSMYEPLTVEDTSYDPAGRTISEKKWTIKKNDVQVYSGTSPLTSFLTYGEGTYRITLLVKNDAGLWSEEFSRTITVTSDTEKPEAIVTPTTQSWSANSPTVSITFSDKGGSGFKHQRYVISDSITPPKAGWSEWNKALTRQISLSNEGSWYIHIEGEDNAGNTFTRTMGEYQIDRTAPLVNHSVDYSSWTNKNVTIHLVSSDSISGINRIQLPNGNLVTESTIDYVVTESGRLTFTIYDNAGHVTTRTVDVSYIDKQNPNPPTVSLNPNGTDWVGKSIFATMTNNGDIGDSKVNRVEYSLTGAITQDWMVYHSPVTLSTDGITNLNVRVVDNAGNSSSVVSKTVKIDQLAPALEVTANLVNLTNTDVILTAKATDGATGVKRIQLPNGNWTNSSQISYQVSENGTYTFKAEDNFGNIRTLPYRVSNIKRDVLITNKREVVLDLHAEDVYSGMGNMQFRNEELDWSVWEPYQTTKAWVLTPIDGLKHVWAKYVDNVGNISSAIEDIIILDMTNPVSSFFQINDNDVYTKTQNVTLKLKASDNLTGLKDVWASNDNVNWTKNPYKENLEWTLSQGDGLKTVYLKVSDNAGNLSNVMTDTIFLDTTKPLAKILINNGDTYTATRDVKLTLTYSDTNGSGIETVKVIEGDKEYILPKPIPNSPTTIDWMLDFGVVKSVSILVIDKAGNMSTLGTDEIIVDKLTLKQFTLENVINSLHFNKKNPFVPKEWEFTPQPMLAGGNITFSADIKEATDSSVAKDKMDYKVDVIGVNGYHKVFMGEMTKKVNHYTQTITLPKDAPNGANVYVSAVGERKLLVSPYDTQTIYFPGGEASSQAQIGKIGANIYDTIRFNETN